MRANGGATGAGGAIDGARPGFTPAPVVAVPEIGVAMLGYGFMGRAHANAYRTLPSTAWPAVVRPRLVAVGGRSAPAVAEAAARFGFAGSYTDWRALVADDRAQVFDNCAWHDAHADPCIAAAERGKHVLCEKPLALDAAEARRMRDAVQRAGVVHMVCFNYRFAPGVRLARELIARGALGTLHHVRISYLQEHQADPAKAYPWVGRRSGALLGLGSHVIDLARFLVGEPRSVTGYVRTFNRRRPHPDGSGRMVDVEDDDTAVAQVEFADGPLCTLEASWACAGRKNQLSFEINGSLGSVAWDLEDLNRLRVSLPPSQRPGDLPGFTDVLVTEPDHPYHQLWWPAGHILGWEHLHINLIHHFLQAVAGGAVAPGGATFEDGYRAAVVSDAIVEASRTGRRATIAY